VNRWLRGALAICAGFGLTMAAITVTDRNAPREIPPGTKLGSLNMDEYCRAEYGDRASAVHIGSGAFGWRCWVVVNELLTPQDITVDTACETIFEPPAYSESFSPESPFSWECFRGPNPES